MTVNAPIFKTTIMVYNIHHRFSKPSYHQWPFQEPNMVLTYLHQLDPGDLPLIYGL